MKNIMAKFCGTCGAPIEDNATFCPKCGAKIREETPSVENTDTFQSTDNESTGNVLNSNMKNIIIGILLAVIVVGAGAGVYYYKHIRNNVASTNATTTNVTPTETTSKTESSDSTRDAASQEPIKDDLTQANEILKSKGYSDTVGAVSPINDAGFLGLITNKGRAFVVYDKKDDVVAILDYKRELLNLRNNKWGNVYSPVILTLHIKNDQANNDRALGYWHNGIHTFSVYSLYDIDADGNIVPGMLTSAQGRNPSHYQAYLKEQQNVNIVNLALTSADSLKQDMDSKNIVF